MTPDAEPGTYLLRQTFRYDYAAPVRRLRHRLLVVPRTVHGDQRLLDHAVAVRGAAATVRAGVDRFGNLVADIRAERVEDAVEFESWAVVVRDGPGGETPVRRAARVGMAEPTRLTAADGFLEEAACELGPDPDRICTWTHRTLAYVPDVTTVRTTAAEAAAGGRGVCQDYAHVMLAVCRAVGLAARYVSGHLVGEGGSHAWVEVLDRGVAVAYDPTHDRRATWGYVTVAVGRDYIDAAPTSGRFDGDVPGLLTTRKSLTRLESGKAPVLT